MPPAPRLYEILLPATASLKRRREWEEEVAALTGGVSALPQPIHGGWKPPRARLVKEKLFPVRVACTGPVLRRLLRFTARHFGQKEVMAYEVSPRVFFHAAG